jgi:hypothetical protein
VSASITCIRRPLSSILETYQVVEKESLTLVFVAVAAYTWPGFSILRVRFGPCFLGRMSRQSQAEALGDQHYTCRTSMRRPAADEMTSAEMPSLTIGGTLFKRVEHPTGDRYPPTYSTVQALLQNVRTMHRDTKPSLPCSPRTERSCRHVKLREFDPEDSTRLKAASIPKVFGSADLDSVS